MGDAVRTLLRGVGQTLITLGVVLLLFCVYELKITDLYTGQQQQELADELRDAWAAAPPTVEVPPTAAPSPGATVPSASPAPVVLVAARGQGWAVLRIPRFGRDYVQTVVEGVSVADLRRGPGHWPGTALPGQVGNVVLSGHRTTYGHPFAQMGELQVGDAVVVETRDTWFTYRMTERRIVAPTAVEEAAPVPGQPGARPTQRLLTMTTCHPKYSARQRMVVRAELAQTLPKAGGAVPDALRAA